MVVSFDKPKTDSKGNLANSGSSAAFCNYMEKEDTLKQEQGEQPEKWFSQERDECKKSEVRASIDSDHQGIRKEEGKFNTGSINPTEEEWKALGKTEEERKENFKAWIQEDFSKEFAGNFHKKDTKGNPIPIEADNVKIYYKVEDNRYYKGTDEEVKNKEHKQGEVKEGFNVHCHFIVARKTEDGQNRISPTTNNKKEFSRDELKTKTEQSFDKRTGYERPLDESYQYAKTMRNGTLAEREAMTEKAILQEQNKPIEQTQKNEQTLIQPQKQEQNNSKGIQM
jgi:hypothetical protein